LGEEKKKEILGRTMNLFFERGIRSCTMDEICAFQRISKKTLYKYFSDKEDLVKSVMASELDRTDKEVKAIMAKGLNAIDESFEISQHVMDNIADLPPLLFYELENYYPEAYKLFENHQNECIRRSMAENLKKGIAEGLYRSDLNTNIIVSIYLTILYNLLSAKLINTKEYSFSTIYRELFIYHTHGISSRKGLDYLQSKLKTNES
jgi:AcrR family transcriptional regulator